MLSIKKITIGLSIAGIAAATATTVNPIPASADHVIGKALAVHECEIYDTDGNTTHTHLIVNRYIEVNKFENLPDGTSAVLILNKPRKVKITCFKLSQDGHIIFY